MHVSFKAGVIVMVPENENDAESLTAFGAEAEGHVFYLTANAERGAALLDLGPREDACREPINISYDVELQWRPISNFALTPFFLEGKHYASVEGFWQGLKYEDQAERDRIAELYGGEAKHAGDGAPPLTHITYGDASVAVGSHGHWDLMQKACEAKFKMNAEAREALLSTGQRPLTHRMRRDSRTIPGAIMADIWMRIRDSLMDKPA